MAGTPPASPDSNDEFLTGVGGDVPGCGGSGNADGSFDDAFAAMAGSWPGGGGKATGGAIASAKAAKIDPPKVVPSVADVAAALTAKDESRLFGGGAAPDFVAREEPAAKRACCGAPAGQETSFVLVKPVTERALKVRPREKGARGDRPPPDQVADAYAVLNLPLTASEADVARKVRQLSRLAHPDKARAEGASARGSSTAFQNLQAAKHLVMNWLRHGRVPTGGDSDCGSADDSGSDLFGEDLGRRDAEGDVMDETHDQGGSDSEAEHEKDIARKTHGSEAGSGNESGKDSDAELAAPNEALVFAHQGGIRSNLSVLAQATLFSRHLQANARKRMCQECLSREVAAGKEVCKPCLKQEARLMGQISRPSGTRRGFQRTDE